MDGRKDRRRDWTDNFFGKYQKLFFIFDGRIHVFLKNPQGSTDGRTYFLENTRSFFPSLMSKNTIFFKENQNF